MRYLYISFFIFMMAATGKSQSLYFPPNTGSTWDTLSPVSLGWCVPRIDSLYAFLDLNNTKAFILLKDGKIVLEKYFDDHTATSPWQWASAGKTITAFMVGIAQQENYLSISDTTSQYLGEGWTICTPEKEEKITIKHQLSMSSGLDDGVPNNACMIDTCLVYLADAGTRWAYHNAPYTLLDEVIQNATSQTLNQYTTQKLKIPTGMTGTFVPLTDNNVFFSTARSMARFGTLMLNKGNWNGNQIMTDTAYFNQMVNTSQDINKSYGYLWWLNGKPNYMVPQSQWVFNGSLCPDAPSDMYVAIGKDGQFLNVIPSQNMTWVRMGEAPNDLPVPYLLNNEIWQYLNQMTCTSIGVQEHTSSQVHVYPNPANDVVYVQSTEQITRVEICNLQGQVLKQVNGLAITKGIAVDDIPAGLYLVKTHSRDGRVSVSKVIRE